jgi:hypothetical protein
VITTIDRYCWLKIDGEHFKLRRDDVQQMSEGAGLLLGGADAIDTSGKHVDKSDFSGSGEANS